MANAKYDNLVPLLASGRLNWPADLIQAFLMEGAAFEAADLRISDVAGTRRGRVALPERSVRPTDGSFHGFPVSFNDVPANTNFSVILAKDDGINDPLVLSFYDRNETNAVIRITVPGTLTVRPLGSDPLTPGTWVEV